jgi:Flp pilus assembly protein TadB
MKKINITTTALLIYLLIMSIISWPGKQVNPNYIQYFAVIGATLLIIFLLRFLQIKRFKNRDKNR